MNTRAPDDAVIVSIDAGTTGVRAFAVDSSGVPVGRSYREFTQYFPAPGLVEHDAEEIWSTTKEVLRDLTKSLGRTVAALGITNQRETAVAWDRKTGRPRSRAIVWQDRRTSDRCDELRDSGHLPTIRERTGLVLDPYFSGTKFEWMIQHGNVNLDSDLMLGTVDCWLTWKLTGGASHVTEPSNASRTMLFDINDLRWSEELCEMFGIPISALPQVLPSAGLFGVTTGDCGVAPGTPITGIAGDQQAALFGQACTSPGMAKNTYGTGSFVLMNTGEKSPGAKKGLLTTVAWTVPGEMLGEPTTRNVTHYALEGAIFVTGAAVQWLRDGLKIIDDASETQSLAASVEDSSGVIIVPAFTGLGSPYWDPHARGTVLGITRGTGRAHLARAVIESMAFQTRDVVDAMSAASESAIRELRVDGGAAAMDLMLQIQADQLDCAVLRSSIAETTALGAAYLAGLGVGMWSTVDDIDSRWTADATFVPGPDRSAPAAAYELWQRGVERSRGWANVADATDSAADR
ncbi:MAG TPA: glycerol kinase GlpK [Microthrixaceae bacterium]|nr:glycerol kinase GlpK [Microthrixaceae bacterium]